MDVAHLPTGAPERAGSCSRWRLNSRALLLGVLVAAAWSARAAEVRVAAVRDVELRDWDLRVAAWAKEGRLRLRRSEPDTLMPGRLHERFTQLHQGVPVWGAELVRQSDAIGAVSAFGTWYEGIDLDVAPRITPDQARSAATQWLGTRLAILEGPELMIFPLDGGSFALVYRLRVWSRQGLRVCFVDARDGRERLDYNDLQSQSAVGRGRGVLGDEKKVSARRQAGAFVAEDVLRPTRISTYDAKGDYLGAFGVCSTEDVECPRPSDLAMDSDNEWGDVAVVDAHAYVGLTYDYYYRRFGRRGPDGRDGVRLRLIVHPVRREDARNPAYQTPGRRGFFVNAFGGEGEILFGEGLPPDLTFRGQHWDYTSGALDLVAHEYTHSVTNYSSDLIYLNESGALNKAFSDIMGTSVEFFYQPPGNGPQRAEYLFWEDTVTPGGIRSLQDPISYGDPDHYSLLFTGPEDNGGVHINSGIANHAFYLAIEGGTHRLSGVSVQGVGGSNREQLEKIFYRAFVFMLPPSADFSTARAATIQAARDLYGEGSAPERAVTQAWSAVGVR